MIPTFVLLTAVGGGLRLALNVAVRRKLAVIHTLPFHTERNAGGFHNPRRSHAAWGRNFERKVA